MGRNSLHLLASQLRYEVVKMTYEAKAAHLASSLSCIDIVTVLYEKILRLDAKQPESPGRDRFILSKGHAAAALYAILAHKGVIDESMLQTYGKKGSLLEEHPSPQIPGVEAATGSLGHGLPIGTGMALSAKIMKKGFRVFVLMSDGECNEGTVWEAAMFAAKKQLGNLCGIVDFNKWQATGRSQEVLALDPLVDKWKSFGWSVHEIDGHDHEQLEKTLDIDSEQQDSPTMIVAHTVKGKGVSFMEDDNNWHYRTPTEEEVQQVKNELGV
jgi:transketolase